MAALSSLKNEMSPMGRNGPPPGEKPGKLTLKEIAALLIAALLYFAFAYGVAMTRREILGP